MAKTATVTVRMNEKMKAKLARLAKARSLSLSDLMIEGAKKQIDYEAWFRKKVQEGLASAARGELVDSDTILRDIEARAEARKRRQAGNP